MNWSSSHFQRRADSDVASGESVNWFQDQKIQDVKKMDSLIAKIDPVFRSRVADYDLKIFHAEVLLAESSLDNAISTLEEEVLLEVPYMHSWLVLLYNTPYPRDVSARIHEKKVDLDSAISAYERLITFDPESKERRLIHPLFY